jgi:hypothetical protein
MSSGNKAWWRTLLIQINGGPSWCLTERGKKAVEELERHQAAWANQMASCVRHSEMKLALEVLRKLRSAMESRRGD